MSEKDPTNPTYYKSVLPDLSPDMEFIHLCERLFTPEEVAGYCKIAALKYQIRSGKKDAAPQEAGKASWYLHYLSELLGRLEDGDYPIPVTLINQKMF